MSLHEYEGNLLTARVDIIGHQCNCLSLGVAGLASFIFEKFPQCNTYYAGRPLKYTTVDFFEVADHPYKFVANMYTQFDTGHPHAAPHLDDASRRLAALDLALEDLFNFMYDEKLTKVGFPRYYGCALAGGDWDAYRDRFRDFANRGPRGEWEVHIVGLPSR